jgi:hypothetical protein
MPGTPSLISSSMIAPKRRFTSSGVVALCFHVPVRSDLPSAVRGARAVRLALPSAVRRVPGGRKFSHCACAVVRQQGANRRHQMPHRDLRGREVSARASRCAACSGPRRLRWPQTPPRPVPAAGLACGTGSRAQPCSWPPRPERPGRGWHGRRQPRRRSRSRWTHPALATRPPSLYRPTGGSWSISRMTKACPNCGCESSAPRPRGCSPAPEGATPCPSGLLTHARSPTSVLTASSRSTWQGASQESSPRSGQEFRLAARGTTRTSSCLPAAAVRPKGSFASPRPGVTHNS